MDNSALKNLRDFLLQYNKISESCFRRCVNHLSDRDLSQDEYGCVDMCTKKHVSSNQKIMQVYVELQASLLEKRTGELKSVGSNEHQQQQYDLNTKINDAKVIHEPERTQDKLL